MVEPRVYEALAKPIVGSLDPFFFEMMEQIRPMLRRVFGTRNEMTIAVSGTGSAGMETAVANFVEPGSKFAVFANGFFADRLSEMGRRQGALVARLEKPWGEIFNPEEAREFLQREKPDVVAFVHAETSTGALQDQRAVTDAAREAGALVIADTVTSLGALPVSLDEMGIDVAYSCSQKGLSCPPGLSPITVSLRALDRRRARTAPVPSWYLDLLLLDTYFEGHRYHHTASATMFYALREGLALIAEEGLEARWERHRRNHLAFVAGIEAMGMAMQVAEGHRLWTLNTPRVPEGVDDGKVRQYLLERRNMEISGGFGPLAGKVFRIGTMGYGSTAENVLLILEALEEALRHAGYTPAGSGRDAAEKALAAV